MVELVVGLAAVVVTQRALELRVARRNEKRARERGAREFGARHYPLFFVLHEAWLVGWLVEAWAGGPTPPRGCWVWLAVFAGAQMLRYWSIRSLGPRWNTRVLVQAGSMPVSTGPYRWGPHPNYVAVAMELAAAPLAVGAPITAAVASVLNAALLLGVRIPCENRALRWAATSTPTGPGAG